LEYLPEPAMSSIKTHLALTELFRDLSDEQLDKVAVIGETATWPRDYVLIRENEHSDSLFIVLSGGVEISINPALISAEGAGGDPVVVAELQPGQVFGEIALVDQGIRSATVRTCRAETEVMRLTRASLMAVCDADVELGYKLMRNLAADLAQKMRNTGLTIRQYGVLLQPKG
jgi:CRP-like cAMP-binding protein